MGLNELPVALLKHIISFLPLVYRCACQAVSKQCEAAAEEVAADHAAANTAEQLSISLRGDSRKQNSFVLWWVDNHRRASGLQISGLNYPHVLYHLASLDGLQQLQMTFSAVQLGTCSSNATRGLMASASNLLLLELQSCHLPGGIMQALTAIAAHASLKHLVLADVTAPATDADEQLPLFLPLSVRQGLSALTSLELSNCSAALAAPGRAYAVPSLVDALAWDVTALSGLQVLSVAPLGYGSTCPSPIFCRRLSQLQDLRRLSLHWQGWGNGNRPQGWVGTNMGPGFHQLTNLQHLELQCCNLQLQVLQGMSQLTHLSLRGVCLVAPSTPHEREGHDLVQLLSQLQGLQHLELTCYKPPSWAAGSSFGGLWPAVDSFGPLLASSKLEHFEMANCLLPARAMQEALACAQPMPELKTFSVQDHTLAMDLWSGVVVGLRTEDISRLVKLCPNLQRCGLVLQPGAQVAALGQLTRLTALSLLDPPQSRQDRSEARVYTDSALQQVLKADAGMLAQLKRVLAGTVSWAGWCLGCVYTVTVAAFVFAGVLLFTVCAGGLMAHVILQPGLQRLFACSSCSSVVSDFSAPEVGHGQCCSGHG